VPIECLWWAAGSPCAADMHSLYTQHLQPGVCVRVMHVLLMTSSRVDVEFIATVTQYGLVFCRDAT
jgi:hypothetical protein